MEVNATQEDFVAWISEALRIESEETNEEYLFNLKEIGVRRTLALQKGVLANTLAELRSMEEVEDTVISSPRCYETLVREESTIPRFRLRMRDEGLSVQDHDNGVEYKLSSPSNAYLLFLLYKISSIASPRALIGPLPIQRILERPGEEEIQGLWQNWVK